MRDGTYSEGKCWEELNLLFKKFELLIYVNDVDEFQKYCVEGKKLGVFFNCRD